MGPVLRPERAAQLPLSRGPYTLVTLTSRDGKLAAIVEQPVVRFARRAVWDEVEEAMHSMCFARVGGDDYAAPARGLRVEDLHDENVVVDADGAMLFTEPIIYAVPQAETQA